MLKNIGMGSFSSLSLLMVLLLSSCENGGRTLEISGEKALVYVQNQIDFGHRVSGSDELRNCAEWLKSEVESFGVSCRIDAWQETSPKGMLTFRNVVATLPGNSKRKIIIGSHFDLKDLKEFDGANDAGSSTAVLLEMIRVLKESELDLPTLEFYFFDGEECLVQYGTEDGLHGSKYAADQIENPADYQAMLLLDMIGDKDLNITLSLNTPDTLAKLAIEQAKLISFKGKIGVDPDLLILDDHVPFSNRGIPSIDLIDFDFGHKNEYWHTTNDSIDKLSVQSLKESGDLALAMILALSRGDDSE